MDECNVDSLTNFQPRSNDVSCICECYVNGKLKIEKQIPTVPFFFTTLSKSNTITHGIIGNSRRLPSFNNSSYAFTGAMTNIALWERTLHPNDFDSKGIIRFR